MLDRISALYSGVDCKRMTMCLFDRVKCKA